MRRTGGMNRYRGSRSEELPRRDESAEKKESGGVRMAGHMGRMALLLQGLDEVGGVGVVDDDAKPESAKTNKIEINVDEVDDVERVPSLREIYKGIKNPINDDRKLAVFIDALAKYGNEDEDYYYSALMRAGDGEKGGRDINVADKQAFEEKAFSLWKDSLRKQARGLTGDKDGLLNYLNMHPEIATQGQLEQSIQETFEGNEDEGQALDAARENGWRGGYSGDWNYVRANAVSAGLVEDRKDIGHRLYLSVDNPDLYAVNSVLLDEFMGADVPFGWKYADDIGDRADNLVIHCSTRDLGKNIAVLREAKQRHPELFDKIKEPVVTSGEIDGWIGYGSEPKETGEKSFNMIRAELLESCIVPEVARWVAEHPKQGVSVGKKKIDLRKFLCLKTASKTIAREKKYGEEKHTDEEWREMTRKIIGIVDQNYEQMLDLIQNDYRFTNDGFAGITFGSRSKDKVMSYKQDDLDGGASRVMRAFKNSVLGMANEVARKEGKRFLNRVRGRIRIKSVEYGVDPNNFCFDKVRMEEMKRFYRAAEKDEGDGGEG